MTAAWIFQDPRQFKKHGPDRAAWYVGWIDPEGKRRCKSCGVGAEASRGCWLPTDETALPLALLIATRAEASRGMLEFTRRAD
jgi:hypothetical protein